MKPLVYYCRWNDAKLRIMGREEGIIRGQLRFLSPDGLENLQDMRFDTATAELTIFDELGAKTIMLDEMGIPKEDFD